MTQKDKTVVSIDTTVYVALQKHAIALGEAIGEKITVPQLIRIWSQEKMIGILSKEKEDKK